MNTLTLQDFVEKKLKKGICLLEKGDLVFLPDEDGWVALQSSTGRFIGQGYLSRQHKGVGWFVTASRDRVDQAFFIKLFTQAKAKRQEFLQSDLTTAFRVFNQDGDGFGGITVDIYGDYAVFSWYNTFVHSLKHQIVAAFQEVYPEILGAYEKNRFQGAPVETAYIYGQEAPDTFVIRENGVAYEVFLNDGWMTGIFLDQHDVRGRLVDGLASGKRLLNLFSYTAAFSVAAAMGGAVETTSVDLAKRSKNLSQAHFEANGLGLESHRFVVMDVFEYFRYAKRKGLTYDVIILDPPSFARNKKQTFSVVKDYHRLIAESLEVLTPNGIIIASTNASNLSVAQFDQQIQKGLVGQEHVYLQLDRLPRDFVYNKEDESSNYLKVYTIQVVNR